MKTMLETAPKYDPWRKPQQRRTLANLAPDSADARRVEAYRRDQADAKKLRDTARCGETAMIGHMLVQEGDSLVKVLTWLDDIELPQHFPGTTKALIDHERGCVHVHLRYEDLNLAHDIEISPRAWEGRRWSYLVESACRSWVDRCCMPTFP
jgi:hypothetical protein